MNVEARFKEIWKPLQLAMQNRRGRREMSAEIQTYRTAIKENTEKAERRLIELLREKNKPLEVTDEVWEESTLKARSHLLREVPHPIEYRVHFCNGTKFSIHPPYHAGMIAQVTWVWKDPGSSMIKPEGYWQASISERPEYEPVANLPTEIDGIPVVMISTTGLCSECLNTAREP